MLGACGLAPDYTMNSTGAKSETLPYDLGAQALHLVKVQDPFNCILV
jgi:hypothetical protein